MTSKNAFVNTIRLPNLLLENKALLWVHDKQPNLIDEYIFTLFPTVEQISRLKSSILSLQKPNYDFPCDEIFKTLRAWV